MVEPESINTRILGWVFAAGTGLVIASIFAVWAFSNKTVIAIDTASRDAKANKMAAERVAAQQAVLPATYRWVDREKGRVSIPIEDAKDFVVRDFTKAN